MTPRAANFREVGVPLAPRTTLKLGGIAAVFLRPETENDVAMVADEARADGTPLLVLGGGSNLVVSDEGFPGRVLSTSMLRGVSVVRETPEAIDVDVAAGEPWDPFVRRAAREGWSGIESLAGIPGLVGATPIQNVGAYGCEVVETITHVRAYDRDAGTFVDLANDECGFGYRASRFKGEDRFVVVRVRFRFPRTGESAPVRYDELARSLGVPLLARAPLARVVETVTELRRRKGMVTDESDPDSVSAGSFFTNPVVTASEFDAFIERAKAEGLGLAAPVPHFPAEGGRVKLAAGWLVENAGFSRGYGAGAIRVSSKHALALVHHGGGTTKELLALARTIRDGVRAKFGVELVPEPVFVGVSLD